MSVMGKAIKSDILHTKQEDLVSRVSEVKYIIHESNSGV